MTIGITTGFISLSITIFLLAMKTAMDYQNTKTTLSNLEQKTKATMENLEKMHCTDIKNIGEKLEEHKDVNSNILKEIKDDIKEVKTMFMDIVKALPKRGDD